MNESQPLVGQGALVAEDVAIVEYPPALAGAPLGLVARLAGPGRRGLVDLDGRGEVVGGIVVMRFGENAPNVIERVGEAQRGRGRALARREGRACLRPEPADQGFSTLSWNVLQILGVVILVIFVFLFHFRSAMVAVITLPVATAATFIAFTF